MAHRRRFSNTSNRRFIDRRDRSRPGSPRQRRLARRRVAPRTPSSQERFLRRDPRTVNVNPRPNVPQLQPQSPTSPVPEQRPATPQPAQTEPVTDPNALPGTITPENTLRNRRIGFDVARGGTSTRGLRSISDQLSALAEDLKTSGSSEFLGGLQDRVSGLLDGGLNREDIVRRQFEAQLPALDERLEQQLEQLGKRTASLGRTGGGFVNTSVGDRFLAAQRSREALLGQLTSQAAGQEIQDQLGLLGAGANLGQVGIQAERAPLAALSAAGGLAGQAANIGLQGAGQRQRADLERLRFLERSQGREDRLAREAQQNELARLALARQGFASDPTGLFLDASRRFGGAAARTGSQAGSGAATAAERFLPRRQPDPSVLRFPEPQVTGPVFNPDPRQDPRLPAPGRARRREVGLDF